jgi:hypothetical protein
VQLAGPPVSRHPTRLDSPSAQLPTRPARLHALHSEVTSGVDPSFDIPPDSCPPGSRLRQHQQRFPAPLCPPRSGPPSRFPKTMTPPSRQNSVLVSQPRTRLGQSISDLGYPRPDHPGDVAVPQVALGTGPSRDTLQTKLPRSVARLATPALSGLPSSSSGGDKFSPTVARRQKSTSEQTKRPVTRPFDLFRQPPHQFPGR